MDAIQKPMQSSELGYQQAVARLTRVSDEMTQSLASIMGYSVNQRVLLKASASGVLYTVTPRVSDIIQWLAVGDNEEHQGPDLACSAVLLRCALANIDNVYVSIRKTTTTANSLPLQKGEWVIFSVDNLNELHCLIAKTGDIFVVMYSM